MLAFLIGLLVAAGPLLRGGWDLWAQSFLFLAAVGGLGLWLAARIALGYVPLPHARTAAWAAGLALLAGLAAAQSPVAAFSVGSWRWLILGLAIFPALSAVSKDERSRIDEALRACAWVLVILAFYQHSREHIGRPFSAFLNTNVFAGTCLMLLPLAWQKRDWFLSAGLLVCLAWSHSVGAWLGLAAALMLTRRQTGAAGYWGGALIGFFCLVAIYAKLKSPDVFHRWQWWVAAARMACARPWFGFGPGSYAFVMPVYQNPGSDLSSLYAHEHFLELAAECGIPYALVWSAGLAHFLRRGGSHKRFGALAVLVQSLWDYPLSIPANFWLFCYLAGSSAPQVSNGVNIPARRKLPAAAAVLAAAAVACAWSWRAWAADRLEAQAVERAARGAPPAQIQELLARSIRAHDDAQAERLAAEMDLKSLPQAASPEEAGALAHEAAAHLERSVALNPYRPSTWAALERLYTQLGEPDKARAAGERAARYAPPSAAAEPAR